MVLTEAYKDGWKAGHADKIEGITLRFGTVSWDSDYWKEYVRGYEDGQREGKVSIG